MLTSMPDILESHEWLLQECQMAEEIQQSMVEAKKQ